MRIINNILSRVPEAFWCGLNFTYNKTEGKAWNLVHAYFLSARNYARSDQIYFHFKNIIRYALKCLLNVFLYLYTKLFFFRRFIWSTNGNDHPTLLKLKENYILVHVYISFIENNKGMFLTF